MKSNFLSTLLILTLLMFLLPLVVLGISSYLEKPTNSDARLQDLEVLEQQFQLKLTLKLLDLEVYTIKENRNTSIVNLLDLEM